jgi:hypothetical protein
MESQMSNILIPGGVAPPDQQPAPEPAADDKDAQRPAIWIEFHPETQSVQVQVNPKKIKTWDFARAVLVMATQASERMAEVQMARAAQAAMNDGAMVDSVMQDLRGNRNGRRGR